MSNDFATGNSSGRHHWGGLPQMRLTSSVKYGFSQLLQNVINTESKHTVVQGVMGISLLGICGYLGYHVSKHLWDVTDTHPSKLEADAILDNAFEQEMVIQYTVHSKASTQPVLVLMGPSFFGKSRVSKAQEGQYSGQVERIPTVTTGLMDENSISVSPVLFLALQKKGFLQNTSAVGGNIFVATPSALIKRCYMKGVVPLCNHNVKPYSVVNAQFPNVYVIGIQPISVNIVKVSITPCLLGPKHNTHMPITSLHIEVPQYIPEKALQITNQLLDQTFQVGNLLGQYLQFSRSNNNMKMTSMMEEFLFNCQKLNLSVEINNMHDWKMYVQYSCLLVQSARLLQDQLALEEIAPGSDIHEFGLSSDNLSFLQNVLKLFTHTMLCITQHGIILYPRKDGTFWLFEISVTLIEQQQILQVLGSISIYQESIPSENLNIPNLRDLIDTVYQCIYSSLISMFVEVNDQETANIANLSKTVEHVVYLRANDIATTHTTKTIPSMHRREKIQKDIAILPSLVQSAKQAASSTLPTPQASQNPIISIQAHKYPHLQETIQRALIDQTLLHKTVSNPTQS